ncbi:hypothetical protein JHK85_020014 [Glycine max]|nr:hypothetical protein JHK85_020014 [Glycine max]KAG5038748.1 hypothetical protein JHK86_019588 [Glycine max]
MLATSTPLVVPVSAPLSSIMMPLLNVGVTTIDALVNLHPPSSALLPSAPTILPSAIPSSSSPPSVSLDHVYTCRDTKSLWSMVYKPKQRNPTNFESGYLGGEWKRHKEVLNKIISLETKVTKWRAITRTVCLQAKLKEFELKVAKEKEENKELEEELIMFKKEVVEQHEKGFLKTVKQVDFFTEGLDLCLFDPFKDVKDDQLLDKEEIVVGEEDDDGEDNEANV